MFNVRGNIVEKSRILDILIPVVAISMVVYQLIIIRIPFAGMVGQMNLHLGFALTLIFLSRLQSKQERRPLALIFLVLSIAATGYVTINMEQLELEAGNPFPPLDFIILGVILVLVVIEGVRLAYGWTMVIVMIIAMLYAFLGHYITGFFHGTYLPPETIISRMGVGGVGSMGIYGTILNISASMIFYVIFFGALLQATGATRFFEQIGRIIGKRVAGGPAMTAVVSSALLGTVTGSAISNVATTGSFTIPLMKKAGYRPYQAGAIESSASTGGQIMPPIMGVAAFVMAGITGVPYGQIALMAVMPALLYFGSVGLYVYFQAKKMNLQSVEIEKVDTKEMILYGPLFIIPLSVLVVLLVLNFTIPLSMVLTIITIIIISLVRKKTRPSLKTWIRGFTQGAIQASEVAMGCASIGLLVGLMTMTGMPIKLPQLIESMSGGVLIFALFLAMLISLLMGCFVATTASYVIVAIVSTPVLIRMGITLIQSHFFSFYFACLGMITPPVGPASMVAANMAQAGYWKTGIESVKATVGGFIIPFLIIYCPILSLNPTEPIWAITGLTGSCLIVLSCQIAVCGYYLSQVSVWERILFTTIAVAFFMSFFLHEIIIAAPSMILFALATAWQWRKRKLSQSTLKLASSVHGS